MASNVYLANTSMTDDYFYSADSELLVVPQQGTLRFFTELGIITLEPQEIAIIPRGLVYRVEVINGPARGFVCENYGRKFNLPDRGPIGANCLANPRDFKTPVAAFEDREVASTVTIKWCGQFHQSGIDHSPLDVVAWHGNYAPVKYDLRTFSPVGAILFDHPDPSIFTVLTAPSPVEGPTLTLYCSETGGWWLKILSGHPGTIKILCPSSWAIYTVCTMQSPTASARVV